MTRSDPQIYIAAVDAINGMNRMAAASVDVIVTSPPYNIGTKYSLYEDTQSYQAYRDWTWDWLNSAHRVLKPKGSLFLNVSGIPTDRRLPHDIERISREEWQLQNEIHWIKSIAIADCTHGHFKPINSPRYLNDCHEYIFHFTKSGTVDLDRLAVGVPYMDQSNLTRWKGPLDRKRCGGNTWWIPYDTVQCHEQKGHPAVFPVDLPRRCIQLHGLPPRELRGEVIVLDPFVGSGTTLLAAAELGCVGIGFDVDPAYAIKAAKRIYAALGVAVVVGKEKS